MLEDVVEVDATIDARMRIDLNVTFLALPCRKVDLVAMDVAGEHQIGMDQAMRKTRVDRSTGQALGPAIIEIINDEDDAPDGGEDGEEEEDIEEDEESDDEDVYSRPGDRRS